MSARTALALVALAAAATLIYARNLDDYFLGDDFDLIGSFEGQPPAYFVRLLASNESGDAWASLGFRAQGGLGYLRPLKIWLLKVDTLVWGTQPFGFHLTATALFAALPPVAFLILRTLEVSRAAAFTAAFTLAIHPIFGAIVPFITAREESLAALLSLCAWLLFLRARLHGRSPAPAVAVYAVSLLAKESAVPMLALPLAWDILVQSPPPRGRSFWGVHASLGLVLILYLGLRLAAFGNLRGGDADTPGFLSPASFVDYHRQFWASLTSPQLFAGAEWPPLGWSMVCAAGAIFAIGAALRRADEPWLRRLLFLGPVWYAVSTAALHGVYFDPRHHALPLAGLALCSGFAFDAVLGQLRPAWRRPLACVALGAASLAFLPPSLRASREWERASAITARVRADVERITRRLPDGGAVMLVNTPQAGGPPYWFGWGLQSALRRPFTPSDVSRRLHVVDWRNREMNRDTSALPSHFDMRIQFSAERPGEIDSIWRRPSAGRPRQREGAMLPRSRP